jgi:GH24 family phage-related lysozyme (muramidase)
MSTIRPSDLFRYYKALPHQMAAVSELEEELLKRVPDLFDKGQPWFKTWSQSGKQTEPVRPAWFAPARKIVAEFEGCVLKAPYLCAAGVATQGFGRTGPSITMGGPAITQAQADQWLADDLQRFADGIHRLLPASQLWGANQQAALISWAFNVGLGAVESSTLRKRLLAGEPGIIVVPQELPKWDKANGKPLAGLTRRRAAEVALFTGAKPVQLQQQAARLEPGSPFSAKITPHFTLGEFALGDPARRFVAQHQLETAAELATFLERVRTQFGGKRVIITSGYRPAAINRAVGGASGSEHLYDAPNVGAVDWYVDGADIYKVQDWCIKNWPYSTGKGAPKGFVHTGIRKGRPKVVWDY